MTISAIHSDSTTPRPPGTNLDPPLEDDPPLDAIAPRRLAALALLPLGGLMVLTVLCGLTSLDVWASGLFYSSSEGEFSFFGTMAASVIYEYSPLPTIVFASAGLFVWVVGRYVPSLRRWRRPGCFSRWWFCLGPGC